MNNKIHTLEKAADELEWAIDEYGNYMTSLETDKTTIRISVLCNGDDEAHITTIARAGINDEIEEQLGSSATIAIKTLREIAPKIKQLIRIEKMTNLGLS